MPTCFHYSDEPCYCNDEDAYAESLGLDEQAGARCDGRCRALGCWEPCVLSSPLHPGACVCQAHAGAALMKGGA